MATQEQAALRGLSSAMPTSSITYNLTNPLGVTRWRLSNPGMETDMSDEDIMNAAQQGATLEDLIGSKAIRRKPDPRNPSEVIAHMRGVW